MNKRTLVAQGTSHNGGVTRAIAVHMDEKTFLELKALALAEDRTISNLSLRILRKSLDDGMSVRA